MQSNSIPGQWALTLNLAQATASISNYQMTPLILSGLMKCFSMLPSHEIIRANIAEIGRVLRPGGWAMVHFKTGYQHPIMRSLSRCLPKSLVTLGLRLTGNDPMMADQSFLGALPVNEGNIKDMFGAAKLKLLQIVEDPTHSAGTRSFAIVSKTPNPPRM